MLSRKNQDNEARTLHAKASLAGVKSDEILQKDIDLNNSGADRAAAHAAESYAAAMKMVTDAKAAAAAATSAQALATAPAFLEVQKNCTSCHTEFRKPT